MVWMIFYAGMFVLYGVLFFRSGKQRKEKRKLLEGMAAYLYAALRKKGWLQEKKVEKEMDRLCPGLKNAARVRQYYIEKISLVLLLLFIGNAVAAACFLSRRLDGLLTQDSSVYRNSYGEGALEAELEVEIYGEGKTVSKEASGEGGGPVTDAVADAGAEAGSVTKPEKERFTVTVGERKYEKETLKKLAEELAALLPGLMLGENESPEEIRSSLNLPPNVEGYPFQISWESSNYSLVYSDGTVINGETKETGETVSLTAALNYEDYKEERVYLIRVCPPVYSAKERLRMRIEEELERMEQESRYGEKLSLPSTVDGRRLSWKERIRDDSWQILLFVCAAAFLSCAAKDSRLHEKVQERERQMMLDYPLLVSKLTLYMGAGMTIRNAFTRIASDYTVKKREKAEVHYAYEEMLFSCHELNSGISESAVYGNFAKRCCLPSYTRLGNLLTQNLKKGSNSLTAALHKEAQEAFEERKNTARKLGEEAGTKLLFPMMLMLGVVMVLIMIPAYYSFSL